MMEHPEFYERSPGDYLIYVNKNQEIDITIARGTQGPGVIIGVTQTENGYNFNIHSMEEGPVSGCISQLELEIDREMKNLILNKKSS